MYSEVIENIYTADEARDLVEQITAVLRHLAGGKKQVDLSKHFQEPFLTPIKRAVSDIDQTDYLKGLKEQVGSLEALKITLAISPNSDLVEFIGNWVRKETGQNTVLEIDTDKTIIGGMILSFKGKYKDYSLRKRLLTQ